MNNEKIKLIYDALDDKKAHDITILDIHHITILADCFIIADGQNFNQVQSMADSVEEAMAKAGYPCKSITGYRAANWILLDYEDVVVHVFDKESRLFYDLERLWRDGIQIKREML